MTTASGHSEFIDADGHVLEHPHEMLDYAPRAYRDRIWHIETDAAGTEWMIMNDERLPAAGLALVGTAGMSAEDRARALNGELRYSEVRPAAFDAAARMADLDVDGIDLSVLYPTYLLGIHGHRDVEFADVQCRVYNDWLSDHVAKSAGRLFGVALVPQQDIERTAREIRRVAAKPGIVGILLRPNPTAGWRHFFDPVYEPIWQAACEVDLAIGLHPYLDARLPGACLGLRVNRIRSSSPWVGEDAPTDVNIDNVFFSQAIANPVDMMTAMAFLLAGGVCERHPRLRLVFLEANGGWVVPWLERLDHHREVFAWDVPQLRMKPSEYFRRQCWISFDPDESALGFSATSPLCGAERIVWASDYPHPDAKFPGVTRELREATEALSPVARERISGQNARVLYGLR